MSGNYSVYKHTAPCGKVYIGITGRNPVNRWANGNGYAGQPYFYNAIQKYGWDNITHEIVCSGLSREEAENKEKALIVEYKSNDRNHGYNISSGGEHPAEGVCKYKGESIGPTYLCLGRNVETGKLILQCKECGRIIERNYPDQRHEAKPCKCALKIYEDLEYSGEIHTIKEWVEIWGTYPHTILHRLEQGYDPKLGYIRPTAVCLICGKTFTKKHSASKYCSRECQFKSMKTRQPHTCLCCGKEFMPHRSSKGLYCSHECFGKSIRKDDKSQEDDRL